MVASRSLTAPRFRVRARVRVSISVSVSVSVRVKVRVRVRALLDSAEVVRGAREGQERQARRRAPG